MEGPILITGGAGYIGSVLTRRLLAAGHSVRVLDRLDFGPEPLQEVAAHPRFEFIKGDLRDPEARKAALAGASVCVHLAAIVGDPACARQPEEATEIMDGASKALFEEARAAGLSRFVFASTCSNYGVMEAGGLLDEDAPLQPQSHYARLKVGFEQFLLAQEPSPMKRSILRFATVYGWSPRLRFDLTVNHFTRDLSLGRTLEIFGADLWRPYCHVSDLAAAAAMAAQWGPDRDGDVYNVGDSEENYTKRSIVEAIRAQTDSGEATFVEGQPGDLRNYRVDFGRIRRETEFRINCRVPDGITEIRRALLSGLIPDPFDPKYVN